MSQNTQLNVNYTVKSIDELAQEYDRVNVGERMVDDMAQDTFKDLIGRSVYEFGNKPEDFDTDHFNEYMKELEVQFKDSLGMVYAVISVDDDGEETRAVRANGKINGVAVKATQRKVTLNGTEYQIKHQPMPGAFRSAKTVILGALEHDIQLLDNDGFPKGKTALENEIKDTKAAKTAIEKFTTVMATATNIADQLLVTELVAAQSLVDTLKAKLDGLNTGLTEED